MSHDELYEAASNAITALAGYPDVSAEQAAASLKSLRAELDTLIDAQQREQTTLEAQARGTAG